MDGNMFNPPAGDDADRTKKLLGLIGGLGLGRDFVGMLADLGGVEIALEDRRFLEGPIIVHNAGDWHRDIPKWMFAQVGMERSEIVMGTLDMLVGPTEIAAVMYAASMAAPLHRELADIYLWATANACSRHYAKPIEEYWQMLGMSPIADAEVVQRGGRLWQDYSSLADSIRRKVIAAQAERDRGFRRADKARTKAESVAAEPAKAAKPVEVEEYRQLSMF